MQKYRIISIEASDIVSRSNSNKLKTGVLIPDYENENTEFKKLFKNFLDWSLDGEYLETVYNSVIGNGFSFTYEKYIYTTAVINVKFTYKYTKGKKELNTKELREKIYNEGFLVDGKKYVRFKRSSGSSRQGKCLFIREELLAEMNKWGDCGLQNKGKSLASWEAYRSLSLSSIKGKVKIPLDSILFLKDKQSKFFDRAISVECEDNDSEVKNIVCEEKEVEVDNKIWDGESLIDESAFEGIFSERHMLLLRNKFFKSCAFKTKLQKWFSDNNITDVRELTKNGGITLAKKVEDIRLVTTESSLKFLKFMDGGLTIDNIKFWIDHVDDEFGVVKYDKRTKYFNGRMVQSSYQFINSIHLTKENVEQLLTDNIGLLENIKHREEVLRYYFTDMVNKEEDDLVDDEYDSEEDDDTNLVGLARRSKLIFDLLYLNHKFSETELYYNFKKAVIKAVRDRFKNGKLLLHGTNAVLFGNGPELLLETIGKFDGNTSVLKKGEIRCFAFNEGEKLVCSRSPHITMGNLYLAKNKISGDIWDYFDLGDNVVCVNAIGENIMHRLNGCDYDSDTMLITNDELLYQRVAENYDKFLVPFCGISNESSEEKPLNQLDHLTSVNQIGRIVNLSQRLNSYIWDKINKGSKLKDVYDIYKDVCVLAVLSGIEIDKAKRTFPIDTGKEIEKISNKYNDKLANKPKFFENVDSLYKLEDKNAGDNLTKKEKTALKKKVKEEIYIPYETSMDYVYDLVPKMANFRIGKEKFRNKIKISEIFTGKVPLPDDDEKVQINNIVTKLSDYKTQINNKYTLIRKCKKDDGDRDSYYMDIEDIINERDDYAREYITNIIVLKGVIENLEKNKSSDWNVYASFLKTDNELVWKLFEKGKEKLPRLIETEDGNIEICKFKYNITTKE